MQKQWKWIATIIGAGAIAAGIACGEAAQPELDLATAVPITTRNTSAGNSDAAGPAATSVTGKPQLTILPTPSIGAAAQADKPRVRVRGATSEPTGVYMAPKVETPTETPYPTRAPTATPDPNTEPSPRWQQFSREDYLAALPDPAAGISWGKDVNDCRAAGNVTAEAIGERWSQPPFSYGFRLADTREHVGQALSGIPGEYQSGRKAIPGLALQVENLCQQWEYIHPEMPIIAVITELELYPLWDGSGEQPERRVWRTGIHYIVQDFYTFNGTTWGADTRIEKIGPAIVEEATCQTRFMPLERRLDGTSWCGP